MNIVDPFLFQAKLSPAALAICTPGAARGRSATPGSNRRSTMSAGRARARPRARTGRGHRRQGQDLPRRIDPRVARVGVVTVSARSHSFPKESGVAAGHLRCRPGVSDAGAVMVGTNTPGRWTATARRSPTTGSTAYREDDPCRITLTSGSTGEPRGIAFSHKAVAAKNARIVSPGNRFPLCSRFYCDLGLATDPDSAT